MFSDIGKNKDIILGVYKKLKSYYHYNKNYIFMKSKLAEFEYDSLEMDNSLLILANLLSDPYNNKNKQLVNGWIEKMDFFVMPKKFTSNNKNNDTFISNNASKSEKINQVNFFIDMPIELYILETLWTVLIGKLLLDKGIMTDCSYGNCINEDVLYNKQEDFLSSINFEKNNLFKIYFPQYCKWKNDIIKAIEFYNHKKRSQLLVSLDIKGFYYSIFWKFDILENLIGENDIYANILFLTEIIQRIFEKYTYKIGEYRNISQKVENKEYVLPIGMFSSMLLSNLYLSKFDIEMINNKNVLHYGRYVDDMLLVLDATDEEKNINEKTVIEEYLIKKNKILSHKCDDIYILNGFSSLQIQKQKVKIFYLDKINSKSLIIQLKKTISYPSQMNIIPDTELRLSDFEEAIYLKMNLSSETKIRDIKQFEIDRFQLGIHMWQIVMNNRAKKDCITIEERAARQHEGDCILKFFKGSKALEYSSNWINAMYYFLLTAETNQKSWQLFQDNIRNAIDKLQICKIQDVYKHKNEMIKKRIKTSLHIYFDICISTVLSLYPNFCKVKDQNIFLLAQKIRKANLFNHYLVSYPLINYADDLDDTIDLTNLSPTVFQKITFKIKESNKSKLSPRFINLEEIFQFVFMCQATRGGNFYLDSENLSVFQKIEYIIDYFYSVNHIYRKKETDIKLSIENDIKDGYIVQKIQIGDNVECKENIKVAIANVKLNVKRCCLGLECAKDTIINRKDLIKFLKKAYIDKKIKVDFLVFPEFYMPLHWVAEILSFVRKTGITVISGLQYITCERQAFNNVAVFSPIKNGRYQSATLLVREKNNYAPMEKKLLAIEKYQCEDQKKPTYQIFNVDGVKYGIFLCYEFTDICARSLYKNKIDMIFVPEHNRDTSYFSNIIETTARDLHTFIVQANTSIYGDSRITGPYSKNDRNLVQIKGGEEDDVIIGTIEIKKVREYEKKEKDEFNETIKRCLNFDKESRYKGETEMFKDYEMHISKTSARFEYYN